MVPTEAGTTAYLENESDGGTHNAAIDPERNTRPRTNEPVGRTERYAQPEIGPKTRTRAKNRACSHMYKQATAKVQPDTGVPPKVGDSTEGRAAITEASDAGLNGERKSRLRGERRRRSDKRTEQHADKNQVHDSRPHGPQDRARRDRTAEPRTATQRDPGREPTQTRGQPDRDGNSTPEKGDQGFSKKKVHENTNEDQIDEEHRGRTRADAGRGTPREGTRSERRHVRRRLHRDVLGPDELRAVDEEQGGRRDRPTWHLGVNGYRDGKRIYDARSGLKAR